MDYTMKIEISNRCICHDAPIVLAHGLRGLIESLPGGVNAELLTGDLYANARREVVERLNDGQVKVLVATGQIPFSRVGKRRVVFTRERLVEYLKEREGVGYSRPSRATECER
jgi:superfamily II DNA/RNA helicase